MSLFKYIPMTEEECNKEKEYPLLEFGTYDFEIIKAESKISKTSGNCMLELQLKIYDKFGKEYIVFDYLISTNKMAWKIRQFCKSVGLIKEYEKGLFNENLCINKTGKAVISIQEGKKDNNGNFYKNKNIVDKYIEIENNNDIKNNNVVNLEEEDLPF